MTFIATGKSTFLTLFIERLRFVVLITTGKNRELVLVALAGFSEEPGWVLTLL